MNYYEFLNKHLETAQGQEFFHNRINFSKTGTNPFSASLFDNNNNAVKINGVSIFSNATKEEVDKINFDNLINNDTNKLSPLEFVLKIFLSIDKIKALADKDGNGEISVDEAKDYITSLLGKDGNAGELSLEDFETALKENNIDLEAVLKGAPEGEKTISDDYAQTQGTYAPMSYSTPVSKSGRDYSTSVQRVIDNDATTLEKLEQEKQTRETLLKEKQEALNVVYKGETPAIKQAKVNFDNAKEEYETAIKEDPGAKKFAKQILKNNQNIEKNQQNIDKNDKAITAKETEISNVKTSLEELKTSLSGLEASLSALPAPSGKEEDRDKDAKIKSKKSELEKTISKKKSEVTKQEKQLENLQKDLEKLNKEKVKLEQEKQELAQEKQKLDELVKQHCSEVTKAKLEAFNKAKENLETVKSKELEKAKSELKTAQDSVKEIDNKIAAKKSEEELRQYTIANGELKPGLFKGALAGKEDLVTELCHKYGVDPALVASIIGLESGWGTSNLAQNNNFMGYRKAGDAGVNSKGFGYFSTPEKGLEASIKNLARYTRFSDVSSVDFDNLNSIGQHYCDASWAPTVRRMYNSRVKQYVA